VLLLLVLPAMSRGDGGDVDDDVLETVNVLPACATSNIAMQTACALHAPARFPSRARLRGSGQRITLVSTGLGGGLRVE